MHVDLNIIICDVVEKYGLSAPEDLNLKRFSKPIRLGQVIDFIIKSEKPSYAAQRGMVDIAGCILNLDLRVFEKKGASVSLTEKEVQLLLILAQSKGLPVGRQSLLDEVWGYAQNVETHTLETHIYRLRQKIEDDPAHPAIILTCDDGYLIL